MFPEISSLVFPVFIVVACSIILSSKLSNIITSTFASNASTNSGIVSTSTSIGLLGEISLAFKIAGLTPPHAFMWFSLMRNASYNPNR